MLIVNYTSTKCSVHIINVMIQLFYMFVNNDNDNNNNNNTYFKLPS